MKRRAKSILAAAAVSAYCVLATGFSVVNQLWLQLSWQSLPSPGGLTNYVEPRNNAFNIYQTADLSVPETNWQLGFCCTNWTLGPVTNGLQWYTSPPVAYPPGQYFFACVTTNSNGEMAPSNVASNAPWNGVVNGLGIGRAK